MMNVENTMINRLGWSVAALWGEINISMEKWAQDERRFTETRPAAKSDYELRGMVTAMRAMGIKFKFDFDENVTKCTAVTIMGTEFKVY